MRIGILGAGIGGLAAALACQQAGIDFELFDHAENPLSGGVALTLWANGLGALKELGAFQQGMDWLHSIHEGSLRTDKNENLYKLPLDWMQSTYGYKPVCVRRSELVTRLYNTLQAPTIHRMHCEDVTLTDAAGVMVRFSEGPREEFDGVIAADGIHSIVRRRFIEDSLRTVDYTAWRGIAIDAEVPAASMGEYMGPGMRFGYATINKSSTYWFATVNDRLLPLGPKTSWENIADRFSTFPKIVQSCIESTPTQAVLRSSLQYVHPCTPMAKETVGLIGDAAHAITPNLGLGAGLALEDARFLLRALKYGQPIQQVLLRYEQNRSNRVARIARFTRWLGQGMQLENRRLVQLRNHAIRRVPNTVANAVWKAVLGESN